MKKIVLSFLMILFSLVVSFSQEIKEKNDIIVLEKEVDDDTYGFTPETPIKVGTGANGGPANQRAYLNLLRDVKGNPIQYNRLGSCCAYKSENGLLGFAMLDKYEIKYKNKKGKNKKRIVYISFYDYEKPKILKGFKTI